MCVEIFSIMDLWSIRFTLCRWSSTFIKLSIDILWVFNLFSRRSRHLWFSNIKPLVPFNCFSMIVRRRARTMWSRMDSYISRKIVKTSRISNVVSVRIVTFLTELSLRNIVHLFLIVLATFSIEAARKKLNYSVNLEKNSWRCKKFISWASRKWIFTYLQIFTRLTE